MYKVAIDADDLFQRELTALEQRQLPWASIQAANRTAWQVREEWRKQMPRVFDRPTRLTLNAVLYRRATRQQPVATVFLRDEAHKGTPPARYLEPQVAGGGRRHKSFEKRLIAAGIMPAGSYAVPGQGAQLDQYGNVPGRTITSILSAVQAQFDRYQNATPASRERRRRRRRRRGGEYFALKTAHGRLQPGVYERIDTGFGSAVRSVVFFVKTVSYRERYDIFGFAQRTYDELFPFYFERELAAAVETAQLRGWT